MKQNSIRMNGNVGGKKTATSRDGDGEGERQRQRMKER
jgi:hypothetical protein